MFSPSFISTYIRKNIKTFVAGCGAGSLGCYCCWFRYLMARTSMILNGSWAPSAISAPKYAANAPSGTTSTALPGRLLYPQTKRSQGNSNLHSRGRHLLRSERALSSAPEGAPTGNYDARVSQEGDLRVLVNSMKKSVTQGGTHAEKLTSKIYMMDISESASKREDSELHPH
jgi:hypothetical protein